LNNDNYSVIERALRWDEIEPEIEVIWFYKVIYYIL
jgi:hypothetical protein